MKSYSIISYIYSRVVVTLLWLESIIYYKSSNALFFNYYLDYIAVCVIISLLLPFSLIWFAGNSYGLNVHLNASFGNILVNIGLNLNGVKMLTDSVIAL